jgi:hypothetical protein
VQKLSNSKDMDIVDVRMQGLNGINGKGYVSDRRAIGNPMTVRGIYLQKPLVGDSIARFLREGMPRGRERGHWLRA